ncbi:uncharacterized protein LOC116426990 [Nomia melanderi]|uniref:uncharacterized protein LOC116426990 n=1 Tax=Nomia melanderi TaxID=2448451 RepID=UPI00130468FA|nr:CDGSH iron-sulfur domain-containing protein 3, mitochondrial [Nomia melanderi]
MSINVLSRILRFSYFNSFKCQTMRYSVKKEENNVEIPKNEIKEYYSANSQKQNGKIYDTKPFKFTCIAGKKYSWCLCGYSHTQPFCDGTHRNQFLKITQRPIRFVVKETKSYWLCNCKQTSNRPFCDGTHMNYETEFVSKKK